MIELCLVESLFGGLLAEPGLGLLEDERVLLAGVVLLEPTYHQPSNYQVVAHLRTQLLGQLGVLDDLLNQFLVVPAAVRILALHDLRQQVLFFLRLGFLLELVFWRHNAKFLLFSNVFSVKLPRFVRLFRLIHHHWFYTIFLFLATFHHKRSEMER